MSKIINSDTPLTLLTENTALPKTLEEYIEKQKAWVRKNNVKIGTKFKVARVVKSNPNGWFYNWVRCMTEAYEQNKTLKVLVSDTKGGVYLSDRCFYPYFALEIVK